MSHEVENMFSVRETPWHSLGSVLGSAPTVTRALQLAGADWSVNLANLSYGREPVPQSMARATVRSDTGALLGVVGPRYRPLQNNDLFAWFQTFIDQGATLETGGVLREGRIVWAMARLPGPDADVVAGDPVLPYLLLSNAHDGKSPAEVRFCATRVVCANTLGAAKREKGNRIRVSHVGDVEKTLAAVKDAIDMARRTFALTVDQYRELAGRQCKAEDLRRYVRAVFAPQATDIPTTIDLESIHVQTDRLAAMVAAKSDAMRVTIGDILDATEARTSSAVEDVIEETEGRLMATIAERFESAPGSDKARGSWWAAYNAITHYVTHDRGSKADTRLASAINGANAAVTDRALAVALKQSV